MIELSNDLIAQLLGAYGLPPIPGVADRIKTYISLLLKWNDKISLTTVTDPVEIVKFHFGESLFATSAAKISESRLADVGSGAGFPGLPLAMVEPTLDVTLIESNLKKCAFLSEVARELHLPRVQVFRGRMEAWPASAEPFDFITARALGLRTELLRWSAKNLSARGKIVLWLGEDDSDEVSRDSAWIWENRHLIPGSKHRYLLIGAPKR